MRFTLALVLTFFVSSTAWAQMEIYPTGSGGGGVTDHGALTGLADNDHPHYCLLTGCTMTGPILQADGATGAPSYSFSSNTDMGMWTVAGNLILQNQTAATVEGRAYLSLRTEAFTLQTYEGVDSNKRAYIEARDNSGMEFTQGALTDNNNYSRLSQYPTTFDWYFNVAGGGEYAPFGLTTAGVVFRDETDVTKTVTLNIATVGAGTNKDWVFPNAADTFVGKATTDTLTNKTFDANGAGNSLSNVDVADLANGTDGQLITWDAAGAPAAVATGSATEVLTSNGAGAAPTFQAQAAGTEYTEDAAAAANPVGPVQILVRDDVPGAQVSADGDNVAQRGTNYGAAYTQIVTSAGAFVDSFGGAGGTSETDEAAYTPTTTAGTPVMFAADETTPDSAAEGVVGIARMTLTRKPYAVIANATGETSAAVGANGLEVDVQVSALPAGAATSALQLADGHNVTVDNAAGAAAVNIQDGGNAITVDGTVTATPAATGAGTEAAAQRVTIANDSTGLLSVDDNAGALTVDWAGVAPPIGAGTEAAALRVAVATDSTIQLEASAVNIGDVDVLTIAAGDNNIGNVDIVTLPDEGQQTAANSISVTPDTDNDSIGATGAAPPGEATYVGGLSSGATGGFLTGIVACDDSNPVDIVTATTTLIVTGVSGRHVRICAVNLVTAAANNVALISGTGATCGTGTTGINGGTTAAEGWNFTANGGIAQGSGLGMIMMTGVAGDSVCIITSAATQLSGAISYTIF